MRKRLLSVVWGPIRWLAVCTAAVAIPAIGGPANAYTPKSPEVQEMVAKGIRFLESDLAADSRIGARALVGMALLMDHAKANHPKIVLAVDVIQGQLGREYKPELLHFSEIYSPGLATIFLIELDPVTYASEIQCLMDYLALVQKPHGGWGYPNRPTGDTSMTQYAVLATWMADHKGFRVSDRSIESVATWLLKTQDPSGAFGYQGTVSSSFVPVEQTPLRHSLSAAGLGCVYICSNLLGMGADHKPDTDVPEALKEVRKEDPAGQLAPVLDEGLFQAAQTRGRRWFTANYKIDPEKYTLYYMYALERYMSFRELVEKGSFGEPKEGEAWYNDGVNFLRKTQEHNGSWDSNCKPTADTAFAILFLLRATKEIIEAPIRSFGDGVLVGNRGLPKESARAEVRGGKIVSRPLLGPAEQLLAVLAEKKIDEKALEQAIDMLGDLPSQQAEQVVGAHAEKLRQLVAVRSPEARMAAVRALAKSRDLDNVPTLIYALTDPDAAIAVAARDGLRRIARRPRGFGLADQHTQEQRKATIENWKAWYLAVRPEAEFGD